jgi:hypothetical protein
MGKDKKLEANLRKNKVLEKEIKQRIQEKGIL